MSDRAAAIDDATMKVGLLMESAQVHQRLAEGQLQKLHAHTQDLDGVVRDEIRRTLVQELQRLTAETTRATRALEKMRHGVAWRSNGMSLGAAVLCALIPIGIARWALPSAADIATLRARRDELAANVAKLEQQGGRIDWRRCGDAKRLCIRVDRKAPAYGEKADYYVIEGY
ncbi:MAG TPA: hypothetical protein VGD54_06265 [Steroidobacteraceae bacterium]